MGENSNCFISIVSICTLIVVISTIIASTTHKPKIATITTINLTVLFTTLIRHGNSSGFSKFVLSCVDVSPSKGYLWFDTGETPDPEDVDYTDSVPKSYPTQTILIILLSQFTLTFYSILGAEFSPQAFGLVYDIGGGWILVVERVRSGPYLTADIQGNAQSYLESIWGFILLGTGFSTQIIAILL